MMAVNLDRIILYATISTVSSLKYMTDPAHLMILLSLLVSSVVIVLHQHTAA